MARAIVNGLTMLIWKVEWRFRVRIPQWEKQRLLDSPPHQGFQLSTSERWSPNLAGDPVSPSVELPGRDEFEVP